MKVQDNVGDPDGPVLWGIGVRRGFKNCGWGHTYNAITESDRFERMMRKKYGGKYNLLIDELPKVWVDKYGCPNPNEFFEKYLYNLLIPRQSKGATHFLKISR